MAQASGQDGILWLVGVVSYTSYKSISINLTTWINPMKILIGIWAAYFHKSSLISY
jgi:hypothetical protein